MKRNLKNIVMILIIIAVGVCSYFTMKNTQKKEKEMPPQMQSQNLNSGNSNMGNNMGEPPAKPDSENNSNRNNNSELEPKEMPDMNQQNSEDGIETIHYVMLGIE